MKRGTDSGSVSFSPVRATLRITLLLTAIGILTNNVYTHITPAAKKLKNCRILISEWNLGTVDPDEQFIELRAYCDNIPKLKSSVDLSRYRLSFVGPKGDVVATCNLKGNKKFKTRTEWFYVVGGRRVKNVDMQFSECQIPSFFLENKLNYVATGKNYPYLILLLYNQEPGRLSIVNLKTEDEKVIPSTLDDNELPKLKKCIQDGYVIGSETQFGNCELFQSLLEEPESKPIVIRDWKAATENEDLSVNRCVESSQPYVPHGLNYSIPSPGELNACDRSFYFKLEDHLPPMDPPSKVRVRDSGSHQHCFIFTSDPDADMTKTITSPENFHLEQDIAMEALRDHDYLPTTLEDPNAIEDMEIDVEDETTDFDIDLDEIDLQGSDSFIWGNCSYFPESWRQDIVNDPDKPVDINVIMKEENCFWYEYLREAKKGKCKLCSHLVRKGIISERSYRIPKIVREGYMYRKGKNRKKINERAIESHASSQMHQISLQYFAAYDKGLRGKELEKEMMRKGGRFRDYFEETEDLLIAAYQAVRMSLSFLNFEIFTETLRYLGVKLGFVHSNYDGMRTLVMFLESMIRKDITSFLNTKQPELGIMLDSSSDIAGTPALGVIFTTFVDDSPKTFFYKVFTLTEGTDGRSLFNSFRSQIESDGLGEYVKNRLTAYVSDGCGTMLSTFHDALKEYVKTPFMHQWCAAHRLNLVSKNSFKNFPFLVKCDVTVNSLASFYGNVATKKREMLREEAVKQGSKTFELKRIKDVRWVASKARAYEVLIEKWNIVVQTTQKIATDKTNDKDTREAANKLVDTLTDGTFLSTAAFLYDVCALFMRVSKTFQTNGGLLIGKRLMIDILREDLRNMGENYGDKLSMFLQHAEYMDVPDDNSTCYGKGMTLESFEQDKVSLYGIPLNVKRTSPGNATLLANKDAYLESLIKGLDKYFDPGSATTDFDFMDARIFSNEVDNQGYAVSQLQTMNENYRWGYDAEKLSRDWKRLVYGLSKHAEFNTRKYDTPEDFWQYYLKVKDNDVGWTEVTRSLLRRIMTVTVSSAEIERIFSLYSAQKTKRRYSLNVDTVSSLVSIKYNTVSTLSRFPSFRYTREFLKTHLRADDPWRRDKSSQKLENMDEHFPLAPYEVP